jgi:hypothetical protein
MGVLAGAAMVVVQWGCAAPPPPRVPVPPPNARGPIVEPERVKPLPDQTENEERLQPGYEDAPLLVQRPPEQRAFVDAYRRVGSPRIAVFVNRTLEGNVLPVNGAEEPSVSVRSSQKSTSGVEVETHTDSGHGDAWHNRYRETTDKFKSNGPGEYTESVDVYLRPGQYDEVQAKSLDYEAIENILTDWLAANGQIAIMSPTMVRQRLSDQQVKDLQSGRPQVLREVAQQLDTDILVQAQAHPTKQTPQGLQVRVIVEALNIRDGLSIGRAVVDIPPPLDKPQISTYTRYLARKIMDDMTGTWTSPQPPAAGEAQGSAPTAAPPMPSTAPPALPIAPNTAPPPPPPPAPPAPDTSVLPAPPLPPASQP